MSHIYEGKRDWKQHQPKTQAEKKTTEVEVLGNSKLRINRHRNEQGFSSICQCDYFGEKDTFASWGCHKLHKMDGLNNRNFLPYSSGG